ncbi:MAG TPA: LacI family DNA-binding transcriptional regulator [Anaerolineaceae bacterium]|nr:LacI family DNA-binding transcriptional regulator [Anaerolineaceae bacterium]
MSSVKKVAERAGVSTATVSRVLMDKPHVRPELRQRVLAAMEDLDYHPNLVARSLRVQKSNIIGLIVSDIRNPFFTYVSRAIEDVAQTQGISVFLGNSDENPEKELTYLEQMRGQKVAGIIFSPTRHSADNFSDLFDLNLPMVIIDRRVRNAAVDSVLIDNVESSYRLTEHLITHGYRQIAGLFGEASTTARERREGFVQALEDHALEPDPELVRNVNATEEDGYQATRKLLAAPDRPRALYTSNGLLATGAFRALRESGLAIPGEIAFVTIDDTPWTRLVSPQITVIQQPTYEIGKTAIELLLERIQDSSRPTRQVVLQSHLVVRHSCGLHD